MVLKKRKLVNMCKNLNAVLSICTIMDTPCLFMANPRSCPDYGEESIRPHQTLPKQTEDTSERTESLIEFADRIDEEFAQRIEGELDSIGIKVEKIESKPEVKSNQKPDRPCQVCGSNEWWQRDSGWNGGWVCGRCHPKPTEMVPDWF